MLFLVVVTTVGPLIVSALLLVSYFFVGVLHRRKPKKKAENKNYVLPEDVADFYSPQEMNAAREVRMGGVSMIFEA
jgi:hypothetical protein